MTERMHDGPAPSLAPKVLPWGVLLKFGAAGLLIAGPAELFLPGGAVAAACGLAPGLFGAILAPRGLSSALAVVAGLTAMALLGTDPGPVAQWIVGLALCGLAGLEATRTGGRAMILVLWAWLALQLMPTLPEADRAVPIAAAAMGAGWSAAHLLGLAGLMRFPKGPPAFGAALGLFLVIGVAVSLVLMQRLDDRFSYWVVLLFTFRAVAPPGMIAPAGLKFATGAIIGSVLAVALGLLHLADWTRLVIAGGLALTGLRLMPHPAPASAAAFSAAIVLGIGPDAHLAFVRIETAILATGLAIGLSYLFSAAARRILAPAP